MANAVGPIRSGATESITAVSGYIGAVKERLLDTKIGKVVCDLLGIKSKGSSATTPLSNGNKDNLALKGPPPQTGLPPAKAAMTSPPPAANHTSSSVILHKQTPGAVAEARPKDILKEITDFKNKVNNFERGVLNLDGRIYQGYKVSVDSFKTLVDEGRQLEKEFIGLQKKIVKEDGEEGLKQINVKSVNKQIGDSIKLARGHFVDESAKEASRGERLEPTAKFSTTQIAEPPRSSSPVAEMVNPRATETKLRQLYDGIMEKIRTGKEIRPDQLQRAQKLFTDALTNGLSARENGVNTTEIKVLLAACERLLKPTDLS